jgi:Ca-activated chloride channel homolog
MGNHRWSWLLAVGSLCLALCSALVPSLHAQRHRAPRIRVDTELVEVPVVVFDERGAIAANLNKDDFRLIDDGVVQQILHLDQVRTPVSFVIAADLSSSMTRKIPFVQEAALSLLDPPERDYDEYSVLTIGNRARQVIPFTQDHEELKQELPLLLTATNEATALFDGIYLGVTEERRRAANQRRAIIVISDGGDNHSVFNLRETRDLLEEADVPVFAVMAGHEFELPMILPKREKPRRAPGIGQVPQFPGLPVGNSSDDYIGPAEREGPHNLSVLTEVTGGGVFTAENLKDLSRIVRTIGLAVRYQYVLSYKPWRADQSDSRGAKKDDSERHSVKVELYPKEKFKKFSIPYYRHFYREPDSARPVANPSASRHDVQIMRR